MLRARLWGASLVGRGVGAKRNRGTDLLEELFQHAPCQASTRGFMAVVLEIVTLVGTGGRRKRWSAVRG